MVTGSATATAVKRAKRAIAIFIVACKWKEGVVWLYDIAL